MLQIRQGVFETNSSSTHSITFMMGDEYEAWKDGDVYLNDGYWYDNSSKYKDKKFVTRDEAIDILKHEPYYESHFWTYAEEDIPSPEDADDDVLAEFDIYTAENFGYNDYLEGDINMYTTPSGETIVAACKYGHD